MNTQEVKTVNPNSGIGDTKNIDMPLLSIITVTRNLIIQGRENTFHSALECVQNQSFRDIEHIILDGLSDDGTQKMIKKLVEKYKNTNNSIKIRYKSEPDKGLYDAMNKGVHTAKGQYILFLNSDDTIASLNVLEKVANSIYSSFPDFVYGTYFVIDGGRKKREFTKTNLAAFLQRMPFHHNSLVVQKNIFEKLGGHDLSYHVSADYEFIFRLLTNGYSGKCLKFPISVFKSGGVSSNVLAVANDHARFWRQFFSDNGSHSNWSHSDYLQWYQIGQIPLRACWFAFKKGRTIPLLRKAAFHSAMITLRRRIQPWRTWNNLK